MALRARLLLTVALAVSPVVGCSQAREAVPDTLATNRRGVLSVATALGSPGFWDADSPESVDGGYEWAIAGELAERFDLELEIVDMAFTDIIAGDLGGADLALAQIVPTVERREFLDFGISYLNADFGILVRNGESIRDLATARRSSWATVAGSQQEVALTETVRPDGGVVTVEDEAIAADAVRTGVVDAALIDLPSALVIAGGDDALEVTSKFPTDGYLAPAFPPGSPNIELIDSALRAMDNDGTLERLEQRWLESLYERPVRDIPTLIVKSTASN